MDVDGPHRPIESVRDFFVHLFTITIGILIALAMEAVVLHHREHAIVREAEKSLDAEIDNNVGRVHKHRAQLMTFINEMTQLHDYVRSRRGGASLSGKQLEISPRGCQKFCALSRFIND